MSVNLSIKNVPEQMVEALRQRAERNHRSMQGEMMAILEAVLLPPQTTPVGPAERTPTRIEDISRTGVRTPAEALLLLREQAAAETRVRADAARSPDHSSRPDAAVEGDPT